MTGIGFDRPIDRPLRVALFGAHSDDIEIGAGGTVMRMVAEMGPLEVRWVVLSAEGARAREARASAHRLLRGVASAEVTVLAFRERYFPHLAELKEWFDAFRDRGAAPDVVIGPSLDDAHQDHRVVAELIRQSFRGSLVLGYEIVKREGDLGRPDLYVELPVATVDAKLAHLEELFGSQRDRHWFRPDVFRGLLAIRGVEGGGKSGYAEAFTARPLVIRAAAGTDPGG